GRRQGGGGARASATVGDGTAVPASTADRLCRLIPARAASSCCCRPARCRSSRTWLTSVAMVEVCQANPTFVKPPLHPSRQVDQIVAEQRRQVAEPRRLHDRGQRAGPDPLGPLVVGPAPAQPALAVALVVAAPPAPAPPPPPPPPP